MSVIAKRTVSLAVLALLSTLAINGATDDPAAVESLSQNSDANGVEFTITSTEGVSYTYFELDGPRVVVDFHDALNRLGFMDRYVGSGGVEQVRVAAFSDVSRDATRVVFDLEREVPFDVINDGGGIVRVRFGAPSATATDTAVVDAAGEERVDRLAASAVGVAVAALQPDTSPISDSEARAPVVEEVSDNSSLRSIEPVALLVSDGEAPTGVFMNLGELTGDSTSPGLSDVNATTVGASPVPAPTPFVAIAAATPSVSPTAPVPAVIPTLALAMSPEELVGRVPPPVEETEADPVRFMGQTVVPIPTPQYTGEIITLDLVGVDVRDFFRLIGDLSGLNLILDPAVGGSLTIALRDVPWDQALDVVLRNFNLGYELQGNVLRVATAATLQTEEDARTTLRTSQDLNAQLVTRTFILSYTDAATVTGIVQDLLSTRGTIIQDARRNALIISDVPSQFGRVDSLIEFLDTPTQQVEIEARLLSASKSFSRSLGSQIGLIAGDLANNAITGLPGASAPLGLPLIANFPAGGSAGLSFLLGAGGDIILDQIISTAEDRGTARLLSRPRVTTQNNQSATVSQGVQIPVQTNVNNTISTQFMDFSLSLTVTPQITEEGTIMLTLAIVNSSPDFGRSVNNIPSVSTQQAATQVMIPDGGTAVIGGILLDNDSVTVSQVPGLGNIPVLGHLFKSTQVVKSTSELLFFVTARIRPSNPLEFLTAPAFEPTSESGSGENPEPRNR